jgi:hypothetical protein
VESLLFFLLGLVLFGSIIRFSKWFRQVSAGGRTVAWLLKCMAALILILIYTKVYPKRSEADAFKYFDDAVILSQVAKEDFGAYSRILVGTTRQADSVYLNRMNYWFRSYDHGLSNDNRLVIRVNAVLNLITQGQYGLNLCFFLFFSFLGGYWLFLFFMHFSPYKWLAFAAAFLLPSTLFWSSGILKEALLMAALGGLVYSLLRVVKSFSWVALVLCILSVLILLHLKVYIFIALFPFVLYAFSHLTWKAFFPALFTTAGLLAMLLLGLTYLFPTWSLLSTLQGKQFDFIQMAKAVHAGSQIPVIPMDGSIWTLIKLIPLGIWNTLFYPSLGMLRNAQTVLAFLENLVLIGLVLGALFGFLRHRTLGYWQIAMIGFSLAVFSLVGMTAPVVGAIVRYKSPVLPFLFFALYHGQSQRFQEFLEQQKWIQWLTTRL